jgi:hypothetical protein
VVVIDPVDFFLEKVVRLTEEYRIYVVTNDSRLISNFQEFTYIKYDIFKDYDNVVYHIKNIPKVDAILTPSERSVVVTEKLNLELKMSVNPYLDIYALRDKSRMKEIWVKRGLPTTKFFPYEIGQNQENLTYPIIIKPVAGNASTGVKLVTDMSDLKSQILKIMMFHKTINEQDDLANIILEEYFEGEEFSVDTFWYKGDPVAAFIMKKHGCEPPYFHDRLYYTPPDFNSETSKKIISLANEAVFVMGIRNGVTHVEVKYNGKDFSIIEAAFRPGGATISYMALQKHVAIDLYQLYFSIMTNNERNIKCIIDDLKSSKRNLCFFYDLAYEKFGTIKEIKGLENLKNNNNLEVIIFSRRKNYVSPEHLSGGNRLGVVIGNYENVKDLFDKEENNFGIELQVLEGE